MSALRLGPALSEHALNAPQPRRPIRSDLVCRLISLLGRDDFDDAFGGTCVRLSGADQVTAFAMDGGHVRCLLAHRPQQDELAVRLCRQYTTRYFARDAFLMSCLSADVLFAARPISGHEIGDDAYRNRLFAKAGLASKFSVLQKRNGRLVYLNFYFRTDAADRLEGAYATLRDHGELLVEALGKHDALSGGLFRERSGKHRIEALLRERFPVLSPREVEACARIVTGHSTQGIALELGLSMATVTTFRKRAYAKLGISSQNELFAHCAGVMTA